MKNISPLIWVALWAIFILVASTVGVGLNLPTTWADLISWDKVAHVFVYMILCFLLIQSFAKGRKRKLVLALALTISIVYGITIEWIQYIFFPNRFFEVFDIFANVVGSVLGAVLGIRWKRKRN
ncbi:MAG: VanZ family protein [Saprospiraceae bacterium]|nr:VanZ family protein [Saprospiraceae bacterium]